MNIYEKLGKVRVVLQNSNIKKSGNNNFAGFKYFTLEDFLPAVNELLLANKLFSVFSIVGDTATLTIINAEKVDEQVVFTSPMAEAQIKGSTPIQCLGGAHTYMKRYLYLNAFEIVEGDVLDALVGTEKLEAKGSYIPKQVLSETLVNELKEMNITLEQIANYKGVSVNQLTNQILTEIIKKKKGQ